MQDYPFTPSASVALAVTATSANVALPTVPQGARSLVITNTGAKVAYVQMGGSSVAAVVATSFPVLALGQVALSIGSEVTYVAAICGGADSTSLVLTVGQGAL